MSENRNIALVTGASGGIGRAVVKTLSENGYFVLPVCRRYEAAQALAAELAAAGYDTAEPAVCDAADAEAVRGLVDGVVRDLGRIDLLVTAAGIAQSGLLTDFSDAQIRQIMDVNFGGTLHYCRAVYPHMVRNKSGAIVTVSSVWGEAGASCEAVYAASKGAVIALSRSLAKELAPSGIRVNCVSPGVIRTKMLDCYTEEDLAALCEETPLGRLGTPEDVAHAVLYLARAEFVTGQVLRVDGGFLDA